MTVEKAIELLDNMIGLVEDSQGNDYDEAITLATDALRREQMFKGVWKKGKMWDEGFGMGESYGYYYTCSVCGHRVRGGYTSCDYRFCSSCGSRNKEE